MIFFSTLLISMFITIALIPPFRSLAIRLHAMDIPDVRKVHPVPMPKCGGAAMALGVFIPTLFWVPINDFTRAFLMGAGVLIVFGLVDDFKNIGYKTKFIGQIVAALIIIFYGGVKIQCLGTLLPDDVLLPDWLSLPLTLIVIVGATNAINLSDGLDGLAGGICMLSFLCIGYLAYQGDNTLIIILSVALIGTIIGFLRYNTFPANLFMGDAGSQFLGFSAITLSLALTQDNTPLSPLLPLILLGFPILDTLSVMSERIAMGGSPFRADNNHLHHKLMRLGLAHTEAVFSIYVLQAFFVTSAFLLRFYSEWLLLIGYTTFSGIVILSFIIADKTGWQMRRGMLEGVIKLRLKRVKDKFIHIKISFKTIYFGFPALLLFSCVVPQSVPEYFSYLTIALLSVILITWFVKWSWLGVVLRGTVFIFIPVLIYISDSSMVPWMSKGFSNVYNVSFGILTLFALLTLKFTRRKMGFKITPVDFLILFIAIVFPNLPDKQIQSLNIGMIAAKTIVLYFSFGVIDGEMRGELNRFGLFIIAALAVISVRGIF